MSKFFLNFFSMLSSSFTGILNIISSDNISYSIFLAKDVTNSTILLLSAFSAIETFKLIYFPYFSIKKRGEPIHFIFPAFIIPILLPRTLASSI